MNKVCRNSLKIYFQEPNLNIFSYRDFIGYNGTYTKNLQDWNSFRVLSYNILADHMARRENFIGNEVKYLEKKLRIQNIFE